MLPSWFACCRCFVWSCLCGRVAGLCLAEPHLEAPLMKGNAAWCVQCWLQSWQGLPHFLSFAAAAADTIAAAVCCWSPFGPIHLCVTGCPLPLR